MSDEISELWTLVLDAWCTALFLMNFVPTWSYNHISKNRFSLPMSKAIWFRRALQGTGAATWCSFSDALIRQGKKTQLKHGNGKDMQKPCVMCTCCYSNLSKKVSVLSSTLIRNASVVVCVWFRLSLAFICLFIADTVCVEKHMCNDSWWTKTCAYISSVQLCLLNSTYWNQDLRNDGSWSPSFMTSLTQIDNLDGIMAGITPKSMIDRAMPFDGDKKAKHPRPTSCRSSFRIASIIFP